MPYMTTTEVANDLGLTRTQVYALAAKLSGFYPKGKLRAKKVTEHDQSLYVMSQHQLLGRTLELAPGDTVEEKLQAIYDGYQLSFEERTMLYQSPDVTVSLTDKLNEIWKNLTGGMSSGRMTRKVTELPSEFDGLNPDECRSKAFDLRVMNPEQAYMLARRRDEKAALDAYVTHLQSLELKPGTKIHGDEIIDVISEFNAYLGAELRGKGAAWRRFRSNLLGTGMLKAPKSGAGYLVVPEPSKED